jgi:putative phosphoesterase
MRIAIFSDIHGNQYALRRFLMMLPNLSVDEFIFCGDIFGYYYGQDEVIAALCQFPNLIWLLGNHDQYFLDLLNGQASLRDLCAKYGNSYKFAAKNSCGWKNLLQSLSPDKSIERCGKKIVIVHGTTDKPLTGRLYPKDVGFVSEIPDADILIMGHTHFRLCVWKNGALLLNPGSLGQARDFMPNCFCVLTLPECSVEYFDIHYDRNNLEKEIKVNDPENEKLIELLHRGYAI